MVRKRKPEPIINIGDIYKFPVNENWGLIQIVNLPDEYTLTIIVFEKIFSDNDIKALDLKKEKILLFGTTFDSRIYNDLWVKIANYTKNLNEIKYPYYKIGLPNEGGVILDYFENDIRPINENEFKLLQYRNITDPLPFEEMFKKYHGLLDEPYEYNKNLYSYALKSIEIVEGKKNTEKI